VAAQGIWEPAGGAAAYPQPGDDFVAQVEALPPPKADAVAWLAGSGPQPGRFARATVVRGSREVPDVQDFRVGACPRRLRAGRRSCFVIGGAAAASLWAYRLRGCSTGLEEGLMLRERTPVLQSVSDPKP